MGNHGAAMESPEAWPPSPFDVPTHDIHRYKDSRSDYCVAVFVINEGERVLRQLERMQSVDSGLDVIIADGGSTDGSLTEENLRSRGVHTLLVKTGPGRLGAQMRMAFAHALESGYRGVVVMDGNNKDDPSALPDFVAALEDGVDHVQGSRFVPGGEGINTPRLRNLGIRLVHAPLISLAAGETNTDTTNGFRAYSGDLLRDPRVAPFRDIFAGYELHYYLAIRAARLGFTTREIPVTRAYPDKGPMPTKITPIKGNLTVLSKLLKACLHRYNPRLSHTD